ncbi:hypothetical protein Tco_0574796, partial [Tanacetum coccineum]
KALRLVLCLWFVPRPMEEVGCLRCSVAPYPLLPHFPFPPPGGGIGGPSYETPLRVVIALASFLGFGMV